MPIEVVDVKELESLDGAEIIQARGVVVLALPIRHDNPLDVWHPMPGVLALHLHH